MLKALSYSELFDLSGFCKEFSAGYDVKKITDADLYWQPGSTPEDRTADLESLWAEDIQHVAIQKQILLGHELAAETLSRLKAANTSDAVLTLTPANIQKLLTVEPIAQTNLVEIQAEGRDPEFPRLCQLSMRP